MPRPVHPGVPQKLASYLLSAILASDSEDYILTRPAEFSRLFVVPWSTSQRYFRKWGITKLVPPADLLSFVEELGIDVRAKAEADIKELSIFAQRLTKYREDNHKERTKRIQPNFFAQEQIRAILKHLPLSKPRSRYADGHR